MKRDWTAARAKVEREIGCRVCGTNQRVEAAHIIGREHDAKPALRWEEMRLRWEDWEEPFPVDPDRIVPLCAPATDSDTCHGKYDAHRLDLLPYLTREEEAQAVADVGLENARMRLCPSAYKVPA